MRLDAGVAVSLFVIEGGAYAFLELIAEFQLQSLNPGDRYATFDNLIQLYHQGLQIFFLFFSFIFYRFS